VPAKRLTSPVTVLRSSAPPAPGTLSIRSRAAARSLPETPNKFGAHLATPTRLTASLPAQPARLNSRATTGFSGTVTVPHTSATPPSGGGSTLDGHVACSSTVPEPAATLTSDDAPNCPVCASATTVAVHRPLPRPANSRCMPSTCAQYSEPIRAPAAIPATTRAAERTRAGRARTPANAAATRTATHAPTTIPSAAGPCQRHVISSAARTPAVRPSVHQAASGMEGRGTGRGGAPLMAGPATES
jgi:hypothetical protein